MSDARLSLRARWIIPVEGEPIENGTLEIIDGRIADRHARHNPLAIDLGNAAIIPGLVNAHTHLEFSGLARPLEPAQPFASWIRALVAERRRCGADVTAAILQGRASVPRRAQPPWAKSPPLIAVTASSRTTARASSPFAS
jgi:cytosine/adenosine deaminase-related metal-dependent hydrolase